MFGKGFIEKVINSFNNQDKITSILPDIAEIEVLNGRLPQINTETIFLQSGEICHFIDRAILIKEKEDIIGYEGINKGWNFKIFKGAYYRTGQSRGRPIREIVSKKTKGIVYITNQRIIFLARTNGFDKKIDRITAIVPYSNAITIQFVNDTITLLLPKSNIAIEIIKLIKQ